MRNSYIILKISLILCLNCAYCTSPENQSLNENQTDKLETQRINYQIYHQWKIPNGGYGKIIVVDTSKKNETDLKLLGETLKYDTRKDRNAFVFVYDDLKAAELRDRIGNMSKKEELFYDKHFIATYTRNINSGYHKLEMMLNGLDGEWKTVGY